MLSESSKAYNYIKNCICVINIIWYVDELSVDVIEDECQILQRLKDFMLSLTSKLPEDHNSLKAANICNCSQYVSFFFLKILNKFLILQYFVHLNFFYHLSIAKIKSLQIKFVFQYIIT